MKCCTKCNTEQPYEMFTKEKSTKDGFSRWCRSCKKEYKDNWYQNNADEQREKGKEYHYKNYEKNKERIIKTANEWQNKNRDRYREIAKKCYEKNKLNKFAYQALARAARRNAVPKWIDEELKKKIQDFYIEARLKTRDSGIKYEVDHIVPLVNNEVCGLHVPCNLRVVTQYENRSKQNKFKE